MSTAECGICMTEIPKRQFVSCTRCVNGMCIRCFRTIATSTSKPDVDCPYCKVAFTTSHVEAQLTKVQIAARRVNLLVKRECDYIQLTCAYISEMTNLCALMTTLQNLQLRIANIRMQQFPLTFPLSREAVASRAEIGLSNRLHNDLEQMRLRMTCVSSHVAQIVSASIHLPDILVEDCVSNAFESRSSHARLPTYDASPDLQELLAIGLSLFDRHVVRPNAFQHAAVRIASIRASHTMSHLARILRSKCKQSLKMGELYDEMWSAIEQDSASKNADPTTRITAFLDKTARSTKRPPELKAWLSLYGRWRAASTNA